MSLEEGSQEITRWDLAFAQDVGIETSFLDCSLQRFDCSANSSHSAWVAGDPCEENLPGDERTGARVM